MNATLVLALPSKGQLYDATSRFFEDCALPIRRDGQGRAYAARLGGVPGVRVLLARADEIPEHVENGSAHLGITGEDLFSERTMDSQRSQLLLPHLGYGGARLVVAVPRAWLDVRTMQDLADVAHKHRQRHGRAMRVATKFPRLTRAFFAQQGVGDYRIVESLGATEGAPAAGVADLIVDLTSTGATLEQNHLKELEDGTALRSEACLVVSSQRGLWTADALAALETIVEQIEAHLRTRKVKILRFFAPATAADDLREALRARFAARLLPSAGGVPAPAGAITELSAVCPDESFFEAVRFLRGEGCGEVVVFRCRFLFGEPSQRLAAFRASLV